MSKGGGGGGTMVQKSEPPKYLLPHLKETAAAAQGLWNQGALPLYGSQMFSPLNDAQNEALTGTMDLARSSPLLGQTEDYLTNAMNTPAGSNPYLDQLLEKYGAKANQIVASNFNATGRYGSGAHAGTAGREIADATLPHLFDQYNKDRNFQMQAATMLPAIEEGKFANLGRIGTVGDTLQSQDQKALDEQIMRFNYENGGGEGAALDEYIRRISQQPSGYGTTTGSNSTSTGIGGTLGNMVSGAGLGMSLGSALGSGGSWLGSLFFPGMGLAGGGLGALAGAFLSDERLKENIKLIGMENGHNLYEFNYKGSPYKYEGVIAQEVQIKNPEAVEEIGGILRVNYAKIGVRFRLAPEKEAKAADKRESRGGTVEARLSAGAGSNQVNRGL